MKLVTLAEEGDEGVMYRISFHCVFVCVWNILLTTRYAMPFRDQPHTNFALANNRSIHATHKMWPLLDNHLDWFDRVQTDRRKSVYLCH